MSETRTNLTNDPSTARGKRLRVVYLMPGVHRKLHEIVADCIDLDEHRIYLSGRPHFGTTSMPRSWIHEIWETHREIEEPHIYRGETRLY